MKLCWLMIAKCALIYYCACLTTKAGVFFGLDSWNCSIKQLRSFHIESNLFFFAFIVDFWPSNPQEHNFPGIFALGNESELFWQMPVKCTAFQEHGFSLRNLTFLSEGILPSLYNLVGSEGFCLSSVHHLNVQKVILDLVSHEKILLKIVLSFRRMWLCFPTVACCIVLQMQTWDQDLPHRVTFIIIINATALLFFFFWSVYMQVSLGCSFCGIFI